MKSLEIPRHKIEQLIRDFKSVHAASKASGIADTTLRRYIAKYNIGTSKNSFLDSEPEMGKIVTLHGGGNKPMTKHYTPYDRWFFDNWVPV